MPLTAKKLWNDDLTATSWYLAAAVLVGAHLFVELVWLWPIDAVALIVFAVLVRTGLWDPVGPVFVYDLIRSARRTRYFVFRALYALGLFLLLLWVYSIWELQTPTRANSVGDQAQALVALAESVFVAFTIAQFAAVVTLTPAYVAGAIAEEKERQTFEFLLASDLGNREIVFGKLAARLGNLVLFLITGLPVLSILQIFGGIDPNLLLASFAVTGLTMASLAGLSILNSVMRRRARDAIVLTYLGGLAYIGLCGLSFILLGVLYDMKWVYPILPPIHIVVEYRDFFIDPLNTADLIWGFNFGNPIVGLYDIESAIASNRSLVDTIERFLLRYALFHGLLTVCCVTWSVRRLRAVAQVQGADGSAARWRWRRRRGPTKRPPPGDNPMLWKEVRVEGGLRLGMFSRYFVCILAAVSFVPVPLIAYFSWMDSSGPGRWFVGGSYREALNVWVRTMSVILGQLYLLAIAVRAAGAIGSERDRDTLDGLMTTPLTIGAILAGKWVGSLLSPRGFGLWLVAVWLIGLLTGSVSVLAVPFLTLALLPPAVFCAALGLWFSTTSRTTLRATLGTLITAILCAGGHWVCLGMCCYLPLSYGAGGNDMKYLGYFQLGMTPPFVLGLAPFKTYGDLEFGGDGATMIAFIFAGAVLWLGAAAILGNITYERFQRLTHRGVWTPGKPPEVSSGEGG